MWWSPLSVRSRRVAPHPSWTTYPPRHTHPSWTIAPQKGPGIRYNPPPPATGKGVGLEIPPGTEIYACENITFPQPRLRTVITAILEFPETI